MPFMKLAFNPGIIKDRTRYSADGYWFDSNLVRFRNGLPERWAGWVPYMEGTALIGACRSLNRFSNLVGQVYMGMGTSKRFYVTQDGILYDVTPIRDTASLTNPFTTTNGSTRVVVTDVAHGTLVGDTVIFSGASAVGGVAADDLNKEFIIDGYISPDEYAITVENAATSSATGGGNPVSAAYLFAAGSDNQSYGDGWGYGGWGEGEWGDSNTAVRGGIGIWTQDNWGEDIVACPIDGPIFYWDATSPGSRMVNIRDLPLADGYAPQGARFIVVSHRDRHLLAFGVSEEFMGSTYAPMTIRWCSQEDITNWNEADTAGTAGSIPLSRGSRFVAIEPTQREILVWSDTALYSLQFVGAPDVYVADIVSEGTDIVGINAAVTFGTMTYWMGRSGFYVYDGRVRKMSSPVWEYVNNNLNWGQCVKVYASSNRAKDEILFFYPGADGLEVSNYVSYDVLNDCWTVGTLSRTAWMDMDYQYAPFAVCSDGTMYYHETGYDDGSQNPPIPLNAYVESAPFELSAEGSYDKGDRFMFIRRILPDVSFAGYDGINQPKMNIVLKTMDKPGGGFTSSSSNQVVKEVILSVDEFTDDIHLRLRGRSLTLRLESNTLGSQWRSGAHRLDLRSDGQR